MKMGFEIDFEALRKRDVFFNQLEKEAKENNLQYFENGLSIDIPDVNIDALLKEDFKGE